MPLRSHCCAPLNLGMRLRVGMIEVTLSLIYSMPWPFCDKHRMKVAWNGRGGSKLAHQEHKGQVKVCLLYYHLLNQSGILTSTDL